MTLRERTDRAFFMVIIRLPGSDFFANKKREDPNVQESRPDTDPPPAATSSISDVVEVTN